MEPVTYTVQDFRKNLADAVGQVQHGGKTIQITKNGKPAAYLISPDDFARLAGATAD
ncbi:type II toxin-antitoxin system Phd/YefM family antitoxin [Actinosynnema sp. NPDC059335]|uniref:type II toxin-antitoxin system Phd/YefM family antitoxin n=1 Tax=Actinosynnema sp. NPDC059335 TaxID=3346804 RepID=UPI00366DA9AD